MVKYPMKSLDDMIKEEFKADSVRWYACFPGESRSPQWDYRATCKLCGAEAWRDPRDRIIIVGGDETCNHERGD